MWYSRRVHLWKLTQAIVLLVCSTWIGCRSVQDPTHSTESLLVDAARAPSFETSNAQATEAYLNDALWSRASTSEDDIDLASLADREGASGLLEAIEIGGKVGLTALAALPMADDAPVAYRRLAQLALLTSGDARTHVLRAIQGVAAQSRLRGEPIDEGGAGECVDVLLRLAGDRRVQTQHRVMAVMALRMPGFAGRVEVGRIPTEFDVVETVDSAGP